jgi:urease accessory protein
MSDLLTTLLLADGRFPAGAHAHSAGMEAAVAEGRVHDLGSLGAYLTGRLTTAGLTDAALAALALLVGGTGDPTAAVEGWRSLDAEAAARIPSPAIREASCRQGRQLLRTGRRVWPDDRLEALAETTGPRGGPHLPVALGAVAGVAGLGPEEVAAAALHHTLTGPSTAAVRLLGLDPVGVARLHARLSADATGVARAAVDAAHTAAGPPFDPSVLPACSSLVVELAADRHATWEVRLFAS